MTVLLVLIFQKLDFHLIHGPKSNLLLKYRDSTYAMPG